jgi:ferredoxin
MDFIGIDLKRLHFAWVSAAEGHKWAKVVSDVTAAVQEAGPLPSFDYPDGWDGIDLPEMAGSGPQELDAGQLDAIRTHLRKAASEATTGGQVGVVIGYGAGFLPDQTVPIFITETADCEKLEWGHGCRNNLSTYVGTALEKHERVAVVAKTCDLGAISGLIREGQLRREQVLVIGVQCPGVRDGSGLATKCLSCSGDPHPICDLVVTTDGVRESCEDTSAAALDTPDARDEQIAHLESLPHDERWKYWRRQFSRCLRCYACRAACPMCYCSSCIADKHRPQWVPTAIDSAGNSTWNIIRAVHLAGRCSGCDECARVCPADIRLDLINRKLSLEVERQYGKTGLDPEEKSALVDFRMEDSEEFIL